MREISILVAEDDPDTLELVKLLLEMEGFSVVGVEDGLAAVECLSTWRPSVIVTDLMMPNLSGLELIKWVKGKSGLATIPVVVISAGGKEILSEAIEAGAIAVIRKPEKLAQLGDAIREICSSDRQSPWGLVA